jgi:predicted ATPase/DNA-binding SARP family transcriptional activator
MEFRLLGPLEVVDDGRALELGGLKQRALLAVLVLEANRVVSVDHLIDALWEEEPPETAQKGLQVYVSRVRNVLGRERLTTVPSGYTLRVGADELDLNRVVALRDEGKFAEALSLWRGPALSDFRYQRFAQSEIGRLEELRLACLEGRIDQDLSEGRHAELIGELEALVAEHPLHQRLHAQLMLALYRSGRDAEALESYRQARGVLVDGLGIEPRRELRELQQAILRQDAALDLVAEHETAESRRAAFVGLELPEPPSDGSSVAREERKLVSVLFADLVDFVARSESGDPEDLRAVLAPYHALVRDRLVGYGGTVEKFIGDAVVGVFGAPAAHEDDAERAVRAGLAILQGVELPVRVAVTTGEAVVALDSRPATGETIVTGDVVNTASRLQHLAPAGGLVVDESTYRATRDVIEYEQLEPVAVKGKRDVIPIWRAERARTRPDELPEPGMQTAFVGREHELELLRRTYGRAIHEAVPQLVTIVGEPGVGKTRLLLEFATMLANSSDRSVVRRGHCLPYGEGITFWALGELLKEEAGILESDTSTTVVRKLSEAVAAVVIDLSEREWITAHLAPLVGVAESVRMVSRDRSESFTAWRRFLELLAARASLVIILEDLHWADPALLEFVEHLLDWATDVPLLVMGTARPELYDQARGWGGGKRNASTISLGPLSQGETATLVVSLLEGAELPDQIEAVLLERAGGNPLYAEEFSRMYRERRVAGGNGGVDVPETVQALIAARLDTLPTQRKALLQDAAVVGEVFWAGAVAAVGARREEEVAADLQELVRKELIRRARESSVASDAEFSFWHILIRDVAYRQIPRADRARKHRGAAAWIERLAAERLTDYAELLAYHYGQALELERAVGAGDDARDLEARTARFLLLAGDRVFSLDIAKAEDYFRRALDLLPESAPERPHAQARLAEAGWLSGRRYNEAVTTYRRAIRQLRANGDNIAAGGAIVQLAAALRERGETGRAPLLLAEAVELLEREPPSSELVHAYTHTARDHMFAGRHELCFEWAEKAIGLATTLGIEEQAVRALQHRGFSRWELGDRGALDDLQEALRIGLESGLGDDTAAAYINLGDVTWWAEGPAAGLAIYEAGIDFSARRGLTLREQWLRAETVWVLFELGRWDDALKVARGVTDWDREHGPTQIAMLVAAYAAHIRLLRGDVGKASAAVDEFLDRAREMKDPQILLPALLVAAETRHAQSDDAVTLSLVREFEQETANRGFWRAMYCNQAVRLAVASGAADLGEALLEGLSIPGLRQALAVTSARAALAEPRGDLKGAAALYAEAAAGWSRFGFIYQEALALADEGRCRRQLGDEDAARPLLAAATERFDRLGIPAP